jgi:hypothetical protein
MSDRTREQALKALLSITPKVSITATNGGQFIKISPENSPSLTIKIPPGMPNRSVTHTLR